MDVHTATISVAVRDTAGKLIMESVLETKASTILQFIHGLRGELHVTFEEGTWAAWLYDLLKPYVANVVGAIRAATRCSKKAARAIGSTGASCPSCCAPTFCGRSTTERMACAR